MDICQQPCKSARLHQEPLTRSTAISHIMWQYVINIHGLYPPGFIKKWNP